MSIAQPRERFLEPGGGRTGVTPPSEERRSAAEVSQRPSPAGAEPQARLHVRPRKPRQQPQLGPPPPCLAGRGRHRPRGDRRGAGGRADREVISSSQTKLFPSPGAGAGGCLSPQQRRSAASLNMHGDRLITVPGDRGRRGRAAHTNFPISLAADPACTPSGPTAQPPSPPFPASVFPHPALPDNPRGVRSMRKAVGAPS